MNKKGVYFHGLESTNTGGKIMWAKSTYNIYNPSLDYKYLNKANVTLDDFIKHLEDSTPEAEVANVLKVARAKALQLGAATEDPETGALIPAAATM